MRRDEYIDFHAVEPEHLAVHQRLTEWARWVAPRAHGWQTSPMFRQYRSKAWQWERPSVKSPMNELHALEVERTVSSLPAAERTALRWCYCFCGSPGNMARHLAVSKAGLAELVRRGRLMLRNRLGIA